jgi:hypothetical protein
MAVESLFKYGRLNEYSEAAISTPTVWFSPPAQLNDPFECRPWFTFNGSPDEIVKSIARELLQYRPELTADNAKAQAVGIFLEGRHRAPNTWKGLRQNVVATLGQKIGLYCLSEHNDSILMWSHYAADHSGYCLEFEATGHTPFFGAAQQVKYGTGFPVVDFFTTPKEEQVDLIFLTKFEGWSYEGERRIVDHDTGPGIREYPPELLQSVTFGLRMPEANRETIRAWVKRRGHAVKFFEAQRHDQQFKIVVREIA